MIRSTFLILVLAALFVPVVGSAQAENPLPVSPGRPHGQHDPHGALDAQTRLSIALQHQAEGRPVEALQTLDDAILRYERDGELRAVRGSLLLSFGRVARALEDLELAAKLRPDDAAIYTNRAQAYRGFGREAEALADLDKAIELDSALLAARFNRGALLHARGDYAKALADFDQCVAIDPHAPAAYFNRASTYEALGRRADALADLQRFRELTDNPQWQRAADELMKAWTEPTPAEEKS